MAGFALITTLYLQEARDYSALQAGPVFVPVAAAARSRARWRAGWSLTVVPESC